MSFVLSSSPHDLDGDIGDKDENQEITSTPGMDEFSAPIKRHSSQECKENKELKDAQDAETSFLIDNDFQHIVVISDLHICSPWFKDPRPLQQLLEDIITNGRNACDCLVIAGDCVDQWVHPVDAVPPTFAQCLEYGSEPAYEWRSNVPVPGYGALFRRLLAQIAGFAHVVYIAGNHDMLVTEEDIEKVFGIDGFTFVPSSGCWQSPGGRVIIEHGHGGDVFNEPFEGEAARNCPSLLKRKVGSLPVGFFISRMVASSADPCKSTPEILATVRNLLLTDANCSTLSDFLMSVEDCRDILLSNSIKAFRMNRWLLLLYIMMRVAGKKSGDAKLNIIKANNDKIVRELNKHTFRLSDTLELTMGEVLMTYESQLRDGGLTAQGVLKNMTRTIIKRCTSKSFGDKEHEDVVLDIQGGLTENLEEYAKVLFEEESSYRRTLGNAEILQPKVLIMGHTHAACLKKVKGRSGCQFIYGNAGGMVGNADKQTYIEITPSTVALKRYDPKFGWKDSEVMNY